MGPETVLIDAGPLYASIDADDDYHAECLGLFRRVRGPLVVPVLTVAEVAYLVRVRLGASAEVRLLGDFANSTYVALPVEDEDWLRIAELAAQYHDLPLGAVDASIIAAAERLGVKTVVTLDRRHFSVVRPRHVDAFELLP